MPTPWDYQDAQFGKDKSAGRQGSNLGTGGDFGQSAQAPLNGNVPAETYPNPFGYGFDSSNGQFSNKEGDPQKLAEQAGADASAFADLQQFANTSSYVLGSRVCNELDEQWKSPHDAAPGAGDGKTGPA